MVMDGIQIGSDHARISAGRVFSHLDEDRLETESIPPLSSTRDNRQEFDALLELIRSNVIGSEDGFLSPYGLRPIIYADYIASGRALKFIEHYIQNEVLPIYGNTHTTSSATGVQTTLFRSEARDIIKRSVNGTKDDVVIFCGSGATAAVNVLVHLLGVGPGDLVITGPYEHHSNLLPWRESGATIVTVDESEDSGIDLRHLDRILCEHRHTQVKIGAFSAVSNITGVITDTNGVSDVLNGHDALSIWDMACAAPYSKVDMNPDHDPRYVKHAVVMSGHKLMGAVSSPGILVVKANLLQNRIPTRPGGGTVFFVTQDRHRYLANFAEREEGGTPDIIGSIRAAMAFDLRRTLDMERVEAVERRLCQYAWERWDGVPNLVVLGDRAAPRLPIFSFMIRAPIPSRFLHHNFVSALLNDLFGIQTRGGCACAGPYALRLLGITGPIADQFERALLDKAEVVRPGFVRLNFAYFETRECLDYICDAVQFVAESGFVPDYVYLVDTGEWRHRSAVTKAVDRRWLGHISYRGGRFNHVTGRRPVPRRDLGQYLRAGHDILQDTVASYSRYMPDASQNLPASAKSLLWFLTPYDAVQLLHDLQYRPDSLLADGAPIDPDRYHLGPSSTSVSPTPSASTPVPLVSAPSVSSSSSLTVESVWIKNQCPDRICCSRPVCANCHHAHEPGSAQCLFCDCVHNRIKTARSDRAAAVTSACAAGRPPAVLDTKLARHLLDRLVRLTTKAVSEFNMFDCHRRAPSLPDRLLVAVSGGKDSLTLVDILMEIRRRAPYKFDLGACTVDPMTPEYDPSPLKKYFEKRGIPYYYQQQPIIESAKTCMRRDAGNRASICSFCARMKRGILYTTARTYGYNVLCMGQHLDDLAESFLMSAFHNGACTTMKANYHVAEGDLRVIRPLALIRERQTREYASVAHLPVIFDNCPACFEAPKERQRIKVLLASQELIHPNLFSSLLRCIKPLMRRENRAYIDGVGSDRDDDNSV